MLEINIPEKYRDYLLIGTCSWKYESWQGLIYRDDIHYSPDDYLPDYAKYLNTVEIDQWFWSLFPAGVRMPDDRTVQVYRDSVPDNFIFTVKAPNSITLTHFYKKQPKGYTDYADKPNDLFLNVQVLEKFIDKLAPFKDKLGPIMFQFEYLNKQKMESLDSFLDQLHEFFAKTPKGFKYAIEIRNKNYLTGKFFKFLKDHNLGFVFLDGYYMPPLHEIFIKFDTVTSDYSIIRLHGPDRLGMESKSGGDWSKIITKMDSGLETAARIVQSNMTRKVRTIVNVNNHYEGCAPLTIQRFISILP